jgi:hypothetical protein
MVGILLGITGVLVGAVALVGAVFIVGMRAKWPPVRAAVVWLGKHGFNKAQMRTAGTPGAYAAIIRHRGRTSGRSYETPVGAVATDDGFLISLPYGRSNWTRNVLADGAATLVHEGDTFALDRPEIIPLGTVETAFAPGDQRMHRIFGVTDVLHLRRADSGTHTSAAA